MLQGQILKLGWRGERGWYAEIESSNRFFSTLTDLDQWLCDIIERAADREKAALLIQDRQRLILSELAFQRPSV